MPLNELLRMSKKQMDTNQRKPFTFTDSTSRRDVDFGELFWENGPIMMHGQSSEVRKNHFQANNIPKNQEIRNVNDSRMAKFSTMDSIMADFSLPVSSSEMGLDQDVDLVPWLNYDMEDHLHNEYTSDFLPELSGITINDPNTENLLPSKDKKSNFHGDSYTNVVDNVMNMKHEIPGKKTPSFPIGNRTSCGTSEVLQFSVPFEHRSRYATTAATTTTTTTNTACNPSSLCAFTNLKLERLNAGQASTSSSFKNYFSFGRPNSVVGRSNVNSSSIPEIGSDKGCTLINSNHVNRSKNNSQKEGFSQTKSPLEQVNMNPESVPAKLSEEILSSNQDDVAKNNNNASSNQAQSGGVNKVGVGGEVNMEAVVATSSACSGNSVERASNELVRDLKRKCPETGESETPSEELEDESVDARKATPRKGSKRSRAAEVHNLSERKRRDRINEKLRALQELIPNCNRVDKVSLLDEAIEYLKTLQLQVQMLSMSSGMYMHPMMLHPGMQPIHGAHMPHFPPMGMGIGMGMGMGMGYGMNMPFQGPPYPIPPPGPTFQGMPNSGLQSFGHVGQGLPMSMMQPTTVPPMVGGPPSNIASALGMPSSIDASILAPSISTKDVIPTHNVNNSISQPSDQATNKGIGDNNLPHGQSRPINTLKTPVPTTQDGNSP